MIFVVVVSSESDISLSPLTRAVLGSFNDNYVARKSIHNIYKNVPIYCKIGGDFNP